MNPIKTINIILIAVSLASTNCCSHCNIKSNVKISKDCSSGEPGLYLKISPKSSSKSKFNFGFAQIEKVGANSKFKMITVTIWDFQYKLVQYPFENGDYKIRFLKDGYLYVTTKININGNAKLFLNAELEEDPEAGKKFMNYNEIQNIFYYTN